LIWKSCPLYSSKQTFVGANGMSAKCQKRTYVPGELFFVLADTANLISNLSIYGSLLQRLVTLCNEVI
jgi:hypothetical protein